MKKDTTSLASQVTEESTTKLVAEYFADHVNLNDFIFDGSETERPPFQFNCGCSSDKIERNCSFFSIFLSLLHHWADCILLHRLPSVRGEQFIPN